jgi:hypothetical protein
MKKIKKSFRVGFVIACALAVGGCSTGVRQQIGDASVGFNANIAKNGQLFGVTGNFSTNQVGVGVSMVTGAGTTNAQTVNVGITGTP